MQFQVCESDDSCQPGAQYTNPRVVVQEHHGAPLLNCSITRVLLLTIASATRFTAACALRRGRTMGALGLMG